MSVKTAIEKTPVRRTSRKAKDATPMESLPGSILFASALKSETRKRRTAVVRPTATRQLQQTEMLAKLQDMQQPSLLSRIFSWFRTHVGTPGSKELRLTETVQLGDKRFVAIIHVEGRKFLIGGGTGGVNLLTQLDEPA